MEWAVSIGFVPFHLELGDVGDGKAKANLKLLSISLPHHHKSESDCPLSCPFSKGKHDGHRLPAGQCSKYQFLAFHHNGDGMPHASPAVQARGESPFLQGKSLIASSRNFPFFQLVYLVSCPCELVLASHFFTQSNPANIATDQLCLHVLKYQMQWFLADISLAGRDHP